MEQTTLTPTRCFVRDLADGQEVNEVFLVRAHARRQKRNGEVFLKLQLGDCTGAVEAVIWDAVDDFAPLCPTGSVVRVLGRFSIDERYGASLTVKRMRAAAEHEYELVHLEEAPPVPYEQLAADLGQLVETIRRPHLRELLARLVDRSTPTGAAIPIADTGLPISSFGQDVSGELYIVSFDGGLHRLQRVLVPNVERMRDFSSSAGSGYK